MWWGSHVRVMWCFSFLLKLMWVAFLIWKCLQHPHPMFITPLQRKAHTLFLLWSWGVPIWMSSSFWGATEDQYANKHDFANRKWNLSVLIEKDRVPSMHTMLDKAIWSLPGASSVASHHKLYCTATGWKGQHRGTGPPMEKS